MLSRLSTMATIAPLTGAPRSSRMVPLMLWLCATTGGAMLAATTRAKGVPPPTHAGRSARVACVTRFTAGRT